jgi:hypothetical protein
MATSRRQHGQPPAIALAGIHRWNRAPMPETQDLDALWLSKSATLAPSRGWLVRW